MNTRPLICLPLLAMLVAPSVAADARIENRVFAEGKKEPISRSTTMFHAGRVFDRIDESKEWFIFDPAGRRFVLVDEGRQRRAELPLLTILEFVDRLDRAAATHADPLVRFAAKPVFDEAYTATSGDLMLAAGVMSYRAATVEPSEPAMVAEYRDFSDWIARLNVMLAPGARPAAARLALNAALERCRRVPTEVVLDTTDARGARAKVRSEHVWHMGLGAGEVDRLTKVWQAAETLPAVDLAAYRSAKR